MFYSQFAKDYEQIFPYKEGVYQFLKETLPLSPSKILDIGCATGHYCGRFSDEGYSTTGIDLDGSMILNAQESYKGPHFEELNLLHIEKLDGQFDGVFSIGNVMAHVPEEGLRNFLKSLKKKMIKGGIWAFQVINWDFILSMKEYDLPLIKTDDKVFVRRYSNIEEGSLYFHTDLKDKSNKSLFSDKITLHPIRSEKYLAIHKEEGFELKGHYSNYKKEAFDPSRFSADIYTFQFKG